VQAIRIGLDALDGGIPIELMMAAEKVMRSKGGLIRCRPGITSPSR
jgi:hypothetical protein